MLTFYLVVTAFLAGIVASHRIDDLWWAVEEGDLEQKWAAWTVVFGTVALVLLWPVVSIIAAGHLAANFFKINLNGFKRP